MSGSLMRLDRHAAARHPGEPRDVRWIEIQRECDLVLVRRVEWPVEVESSRVEDVPEVFRALREIVEPICLAVERELHALGWHGLAVDDKLADIDDRER